MTRGEEMELKSTDFHVDYPDINRHWSPISEKYAGADSFVTALRNGWRIVGDIYFEKFWHAGTRLTGVFHITLQRGDETMLMPVLSNPYSRRLMYMNRVTVHPIEERSRNTNKSEA
jgi:hypothetical protein